MIILKIGLIDVDSHNYPNIPLMKISSFHKKNGDDVKWYDPTTSGHCDKVYMSKVFSFTNDYEHYIDADEIIKGGTGYAIRLIEGVEVYDKRNDTRLPYEIEHIYPDYTLYGDITKDTAYGFLTRGCPRGCEFCHVKNKEGGSSVVVADLREFWDGQKNIVLCDPNLLACNDWENLLLQLIDSKASVDFNQGLDIRLMTEKKAEMIKKIKTKSIHFAWDSYSDKDMVVSKFKMFKEISGWNYRKMSVYVLVNFDTTIDQDLDRIYTLRDLGYNPYVMIYNKSNTNPKDTVRQLQRYVNNRIIFRSKNCKTFDEYKGMKK